MTLPNENWALRRVLAAFIRVSPLPRRFFMGWLDRWIDGVLALAGRLPAVIRAGSPFHPGGGLRLHFGCF